MEKYILKNGIEAIIKRNKNTPRIALAMYMGINKDETKSGIYYIISQLMYQGTKTKTAEEIAAYLDENAIDLCIEKKADYLRIKLQCLNEDIEKALEILEDIIQNSTFEAYKKEAEKIKGEFLSDLDSAKITAQDDYYRHIFQNHSYGTGRQEIINEINSITKEDIINSYNEVKDNSPKNICIIGDIDETKIKQLLDKHLSDLKNAKTKDERKKIIPIENKTISTVEKEDANQAQIFQGWLFPSIYSEEYASIILLNTILGSSGLSSRLFLELREKQGLAYTVRSVYEPCMQGGHFFVYIGTEPKNIKTSIIGFDKEINKIMTEIISNEELENAKNNAIGKRQFYQETNMSEAVLKGYYEFLGLGYTFEEELIEKIKKITAEEIMQTAKKYFDKPAVISVLAPKKYLTESGLIC